MYTRLGKTDLIYGETFHEFHHFLFNVKEKLT